MSRSMRRDGVVSRKFAEVQREMQRRALRAADRDATNEGVRECFCDPRLLQMSIEPNWQSSTVLGLARHIQALRDFDLLPILADALEEAGCHDSFLLHHARDPGPHRLGCWLVEILLRGR